MFGPVRMVLASVAVLVATTANGCQPPVATTTVTASADGFVDATLPTTGYGSDLSLVADGSPAREVFVQFDLTGLQNTVTDARLRLHVSTVSNAGSPVGGSVARVDGSTWTEADLTHATRPTSWGPTVGELGAVAVDSWVELTVTQAVTVGGVLTLGIRTTNADGAYYDSRESGANAPQLVVTTGPAPAAVTGVTIAAVGDLVCAPGGATTATACRQKQVSDALLADPSVSALLVLGDLQYDNGELASFQTAYEASYGRLKSITRPAPGNHEYGTTGAAGYYAYFGAAAGDPAKGYYSFDVGSTWHVAMLNSNCTIVSCAAGSAQEQWLRGDLAASGRPCVISVWHHPRFTSGDGHTDDASVAPLWAALQEAGAEISLTGHVHNYERFAPQAGDASPSATGIREFVVGTGGKGIYGFVGAHANSQVRLTMFGYLRLTLGESSYAWQLLDESATIRDQGTGTCH